MQKFLFVCFFCIFYARAQDDVPARATINLSWFAGGVNQESRPHTWTIQQNAAVHAPQVEVVTKNLGLGFFPSRLAAGYRGEGFVSSRPATAVPAYHEGFGSIRIPGLAGHRAIFGFARQTLESRSDPVSSFFNVALAGPVVGMAGERQLGGFTVAEYSGRVYPWLRRSEGWTGMSKVGGARTWGFELRAVAGREISRRVRVTAGYQYRRFETPFNLAFWPDTLVVKGVVVGIGSSF